MTLAKHTFANLGGAILPMAVALVTVPPYLATIGPERFGVLALVWTALGYLGFMDLGLGRAITQRLSQISEGERHESAAVLWTGIAASFLLGAAGALVAWAVADSVIEAFTTLSPHWRAELKSGVAWVLVCLPFVLIGSALTGALQARLRFVEINAIQVGSGVLGHTLPLGIALLGHLQLHELVIAALSARILAIVLLFAQCRRHVPLIGRPRITRRHLRPLFSYGGWISVLTMVGPLLVTADRFLIATLAGTRAVAHYAVPYDLVSRLMVVSGSLSAALFPRLAAAGEQEGRALAMRASAVLLASMTPIVVLGLLLVHPFLSVWVGVDFAHDARGAAELILVGVWVNALVIPHHTRFLAKENPRAVAIILLLELAPYVLVLWFATNLWGIVGAAGAWTLRVIVDTALLLRLNRTLLEVIRAASLSFLLLACGFAVAWAAPSPELRILFAFLLVSLSIVKDRVLLASVLPSLRGRGAQR